MGYNILYLKMKANTIHKIVMNAFDGGGGGCIVSLSTFLSCYLS
jgi:hypothetical protein